MQDREYRIILPDGRMKAYNEQQFNSDNVQGWLKDNSQARVVEHIPYNDSDDDVRDGDVYTISLPDGHTKTYTHEQMQSDNVRGWLANNPKAAVSKWRQYDYWADQNVKPEKDDAMYQITDADGSRQLLTSQEYHANRAQYTPTQSRSVTRMTTDELGKQYSTDPEFMAHVDHLRNVQDLQKFMAENGQMIEDWNKELKWQQSGTPDRVGESFWDKYPDRPKDPREAMKDVLAERDRLVAQRNANPYYRSIIDKDKDAAKELLEELGAMPSTAQEAKDAIGKGGPTGSAAVYWYLKRNAGLSKADRKARNITQQALKLLEAPDKESDKENGFANFLKGGGDTLTDPAFWTRGISTMIDNAGVKDSVDNIRRKLGGRELTIEDLENPDAIKDVLNPDEVRLIKALAIKMNAEFNRALDLSNMYQSGQTATESLGFMLEFLATGAIAKGVGGAVAGAFDKWANASKAAMTARGASAAAQTAAQAGIRTGEALVSPVVSSAARMWYMPSTYRNLSDAAAYDMNYATGKLEEGKVGWKDILDQGIEVWSETALEPLFALAGEGLGYLGKTKTGASVARWLKEQPLGNFAILAHNGDFAKLLRDAGFHGYLEEMLEEVLGAGTRQALGVDDKAWEQFWDKEQLGQMAVAFLPMSIAGGFGVAANIKRANRNFEQEKNYISDFLQRGGMNASDVQDLLNRKAHTMDEIAANINDVVRAAKESGTLTEEDKLHLMRFAAAQSQKELFEAIQNAEGAQKNADLAKEMEETMGGRFYRTEKTEDESAPEVDVVETIQYADGRRVFITAKDDEGMVGLDTEGHRVVISNEKLAEEEASGLVQSHQYQTLKEFIAQEREARRAAEEQDRLAQDDNRFLQAVKDRVAEEKSIPVMIDGQQDSLPIIEMTDEGVTAVLDEKGTLQNYTWGQVADALGMPLHGTTDADIQAAQDAEEVRMMDVIAGLNKMRGTRFTYNGASYNIADVAEDLPDEQGIPSGTVTIQTEQGNSLTIPNADAVAIFESLQSQEQAMAEATAREEQAAAEEVGEETAEEEQTPEEEPAAAPAVPTDEKGNKLYSQAPVELTYADIYGNPAFESKEEADGFINGKIKRAKDAADKAQKKVDKVKAENYDTPEQYREAKDKAKAELQPLLDEYNYWQGVKQFAAAAEQVAQEAAEETIAEAPQVAAGEPQVEANEQEVNAPAVSAETPQVAATAEEEPVAEVTEPEAPAVEEPALAPAAEQVEGPSGDQVGTKLEETAEEPAAPIAEETTQQEPEAAPAPVSETSSTEETPAPVEEVNETVNENPAVDVAAQQTGEELVNEAVNLVNEIVDARQRKTNAHEEWFKDKTDASTGEWNKIREETDKTINESKAKLLSIAKRMTPEDLDKLGGRVETFDGRQVLNEISAAIAEDSRKSRISAFIQEAQKTIPTKAKPVGKINLYASAGKNDMQPLLTGVFYDKDGYAVVTNAHILLADAEQYDKKKAGKVIGKDGKNIIGKYPDWKSLYEKKQRAGERTEKVDFAALRDFIASAKAQREAEWQAKKEANETTGPKKNYVNDSIVLLNVGDNTVIGFKLEFLSQLADFAEKIGAKEIRYIDGKRAIVIQTKKGVGLLMPVMVDLEVPGYVHATEKEYAEDRVAFGYFSFGQNEYQRRAEAEAKAAAQKENSEKAQAYLAGATPEEFAALKEKQASLQEMLDGIVDENHPAAVVTRAGVYDKLKEDGVSERHIEQVRKGLATPDRTRAFFVPGKGIYIIADDVTDNEDARDAYVHERQHQITREQGLVATLETMAGFVREKILAAMEKMGASDYYRSLSNAAIADEFISHTMQLAYSSRSEEEFEEKLREAGVDNEEIINFVKTIDHEQRTSTDLSAARRYPVREERSEGGRREDDSDSGSIPEGDLGREGDRPSEQSESGPGEQGSVEQQALAEQERKEEAKAIVEGERTKATDTAAAASNPQVAISGAQEKYDDFGQKIGMARKDIAVTPQKRGNADDRPAWMKKYRTINVEMFTPAQQEVVNRVAGSGRNFTEVVDDIAKGTNFEKPFVGFYEEEKKGYFGKYKVKRYITDENRQPIIFTSQAQYDATLPVFEAKDQGYRVRQKGDKFIITRQASNGKMVEYAEFDTKEEATAYLASPEGATSLLNRKRENFELPALTELTRVGMPDYRNGRNITPDDMMKTFGFRGGEFGNWLNADERQQFLNYAYDALMDLACILNVTPRALTLNGELSIAFGARGRQGARAHYEPDRAVINLTKMNGAGSLAHEWGHALDNYFGLMDAKRERIREKGKGIAQDWNLRYLSEGTSYNRGVRREVVDAFNKVMSTLKTKEVTRAIEVEKTQKQIDDFRKYANRQLEDYIERYQIGRRTMKYNRKTKGYAEATYKLTDEQVEQLRSLVAQLDADPTFKWQYNFAKDGFRAEGDVATKIYDLIADVAPNKKESMGPLNDFFYYYSRVYNLLPRLEAAKRGESETVKVDTKVYEDSKWFDKGRASSYYSSDVEMFARGIEVFVMATMREQNQTSDYLTYDKGSLYQHIWEHSPYAIWDELTPVKEAYRALFDAIQEKTDEETGNQVLFSKEEMKNIVSSRYDTDLGRTTQQGDPSQVRGSVYGGPGGNVGRGESGVLGPLSDMGVWRRSYNISERVGEEEGRIELEDLERLFYDLNENQEIVPLFEKVVNLAKNFGEIRAFVRTPEDPELAGQAKFNGDIYYNPLMLTIPRYRKQAADIITHELTHGVTLSTLALYENNPSALLSWQREAAEEIYAIHSQLKADPKWDAYPYKKLLEHRLKNPAELVAGMSDPKFREYLKEIKDGERSMWQRLVDAIKRLLGIDETAGTMFERLDKAADNLINSFDPIFWEQTKDWDAIDKVFGTLVYHGTGADFEEFDLSHLGEGEGSQIYGYGVYLTDNKDTGLAYARSIGGSDEMYQSAVSSIESEQAGIAMKLEKGVSEEERKALEERFALLDQRKKDMQRHLYVVNIPEDNGENYIHWEEPITYRQSNAIMAEVRKRLGDEAYGVWGDEFDRELKSALGYGTLGRYVESGLDYFLGNEYNYATDENPGAKRNAELLHSVGIIGFEVPIDLNGGKRYEGSNYVIFNEDDLEIKDNIRFSKKVESVAENDDIRFSKRTKEDPKRVIPAYKLMRLGEDGKVYPLFIDSAEPLEIGQWYDAESPDLSMLKKMPAGVFLVNYEDGTYQYLEDYAEEHGFTAKKFPPKSAIDEATANGLRWVYIEDTDRKQRRYEGDTRKYYNLGINGAGSVGTYAMRPGFHAGTLPTMRQIGKGAEKNLRDDSFVWVKGSIPADINYQEEADKNPDKDIPTHIPTDGYYLKATNADKKKSQADRVGWYVAGSFRPDRILGDQEARDIIDRWNAIHYNDTPVEYDYPRESGRTFNAEAMQLEGDDDIRFSKEAAAELYDRYENQDGAKYPWMSEGELLDEIEQKIPQGIETEELFSLIDRYRRLDAQDFEEGRRDYSGGEKDDLFSDILNELRDYAMQNLSDDIRFAKANANQAIFVSNAEKAVEGIQMQKATPEQWLKMLEKNGGLKAGEDKWLGLSDWLRSKEREDDWYKDIHAVTEYNDESRRIAHGIKDGDAKAIETAAKGMAEFIKDGDILVPIPSRSGRATTSLILAEKIAESAGMGTVVDVLEGKERESLYDLKKVGSKLPSPEELGFDMRLNVYLPTDGRILLVDNVAATGTTIKAALSVIPEAETLVYAKDDSAYTPSGKSLTKEEVLAFINENKIKIEEKQYGEIDDWPEDFKKKYPDFERAYAIDQDEFHGSAYIDTVTDIPAAVKMYNEAHEDQIELNYDWQDPASSITDEDYKKLIKYGDELMKEGTKNEINHTRLSYTTGGLENKREIALTVPTIEPYEESDKIHFGDAGEGRAIAWVRFGDAERISNAGARKRSIDARVSVEAYIADHPYNLTDDEKAELAELKKVRDDAIAEEAEYAATLFIDEIQSKRHQDAREKGYQGSADEYMAEKGLGFRETDKMYELFWLNDGREIAAISKSLPEASTPEKAKDYLVKMDFSYNKRVPAAPFEKNWMELAFKRMLRLAAEENYDYVAWTTGQQQTDRYNLANTISEIDVNVPKNSDERIVNLHYNTHGEGGDYYNLLLDKDGNIVHGNFAGQNIGQVVGKEMAVKIMGAETNMTISGDGLKVGGEGMKGFYDDMLPRFVNKYCKKWGVQVSDKEFPDLNGGITAHTIPVTQEMKDSVMEGQVMFSKEGHEKGPFGTILRGYEGNAKEAIKKLIELKEGEAIGALTHPDIGSIDLVWGEEGTGHSDGFGLAKLVKYHPEVVENLQEILNDMHIVSKSENRINLESEKYKAAVRLTWDDQRKTWLLTVFEKKNSALDNTTDTGETSNGSGRNDTATPQNTVSEDKGSNNSETSKENDALYSKTSDTIADARQQVEDAEAAATQTLQEQMRAVGARLSDLRKAAAAQREYDRETIKAVTNLARRMMEEKLLSDLNTNEVKRLLAVTRASVGRKHLNAAVDSIVDIITANQLRQQKNALKDLLALKATKVNDRGIEVGGKLDVIGQAVLKTFKRYMSTMAVTAEGLDTKAIDEAIADAEERLTSEDKTIADNAAAELSALHLAKYYGEEIGASEQEEHDLRQEIVRMRERHRAGQMSGTAYREAVAEAEDAIRQNNAERIEAYDRVMGSLAEMMAGSRERLNVREEAEKTRVEAIHHYANSDMSGTPSNEHGNKGDKITNNSILRFLNGPLATFEQMLKAFGRKSARGEGYLYNKFMRGWVDARENEINGIRSAKKELDKKVQEVFGKKNMRWSDLYSIERKMPTAKVTWFDGGQMREHELTQGNLLYIYMVNKMSDGRMKLRAMGITQEDVDAIEKQMDSRFLKLADWLQEEFLVNRRNKYNEVYERMFGAPMAAIENYFPLRINAGSRVRDLDVAEEEHEAKPGTITGSIIKRRRNARALDILGSDAFSVAADHIDEMEHWAAFAEYNRDLNTLLSYKHFRNQVENLSSLLYGAGPAVWRNFKKSAEIAVGAYQPAGKKSDIDRAAVNIAKGVSTAKISFRLYTAIKQLLSMPAYLPDANIGRLVKNMATPWESWKWSMENLPIFRERFEGRLAGDTRLMNTDSDWKLWQNNAVKIASKWGLSPNAFVDALTVAIGAKSMYDTKKAGYLDKGYSEEEADKRARQDATILYNESQQSTEGAFLSAMQLDRTWAATALTVFRNSSMGYQRQMVDAIRNMGRRLTPGYKKASIDFMTKQMVRDGIPEADAQKAAEKIYNKAIFRDAMRAATFGYVLQFAWNLGSYLPYLFFGDDDDKKWEDVKEAARHAVFGGVEGLSGGNLLSEIANTVAFKDGIKGVRSSNLDLMPIMSDVKRIFETAKYDKMAAANDILNLGIQSLIGVNPQTFTDIAVAIYDACNGDPETTKEAMMLIMRIMQVPQSQLDQLVIDELGIKAGEAMELSPEELARRYAEYRIKRGAPITGWAYSDDDEFKRIKSYEKRFNDMIKDRRKLKRTDAEKAYDQWLEDVYKPVTKSIRDLLKTDRDKDAYGDYIDPVEKAQLINEFRHSDEYRSYLRLQGRKKTIDRVAKRLKEAEGDSRIRLEQRLLRLKEEFANELNKNNK